MAIILGIDTGGTYTDGVIVEKESNQILATSKARTTHHDLTLGIRDCLAKLEYNDFANVAYVSLSTTLATNSIVENRGCKVGLLILGYEDEFDIPSCEVTKVSGQFDNFGNEIEALDIKEIMAAIEKIRDKVDAVTISGLFSIRNPQHEEEVKNIVEQQLNVPVVTAHTLSSSLGIIERTITAVLNAQLIFLIKDLVAAVQIVLKERGVDAPLMILKGDGSLLSSSLGCEYPIETILSGPAASIIGSNFLMGTKDSLILDMGGTTTDTAIVKKGLPRLRYDGAKIGDWRTKVATAEINTFGLGGDSRVFFNTRKKRIEIGVQRCYSISFICEKYPHYFDELRSIRFKNSKALSYELHEGLLLLRPPKNIEMLMGLEKEIVEILQNGPHTLMKISELLDCDQELLHFEGLLSQGIIGFVGFTPTDTLVYTKEYEYGNKDGVDLVVSFLSSKSGLEPKNFIETVRELVIQKLCRLICLSILDYEKAPIWDESDVMTEYLFKEMVNGENHSLLGCGFHLGLPIIGVGAPVKAWLPQVGERLGTTVCFPPYNEVANAVGAANAKVKRIYKVYIKSHEMMELLIFTPWGRKSIKNSHFTQGEESLSFKESIDQGVAVAIAMTRKQIAEEMESQGIDDYEMIIEREDSQVNDSYVKNMQIYIETRLTFIVTGKAQCS